jgi:Arc/MetJ family transcription regulator
VTKRLVDIDDEKLAAVRAALGTATTKSTVNGALDEVLALMARREALLAAATVDVSALADRDARRAAWG